eukprot:COSAG04_NODE_29159_length_271_cov_0.337209_1_plen_62_part_01
MEWGVVVGGGGGGGGEGGGGVCGVVRLGAGWGMCGRTAWFNWKRGVVRRSNVFVRSRLCVRQ